MKIFSTRFSDFSKDSMLRGDEKFHLGMMKSGWNIFGTPICGNIRLSEVLNEDYLLCPYEDGVEYRGIPTGQTYLDEDGDIIDFLPVTSDNRPGRLRYSITADHILISSLRLAKSPALNFDIPNLSEYVFSNGFYIFKVADNWEKRFVLYVLRSEKIKSLIDNSIYRGIGISAYRLKDLLNIEIRNISLGEQRKALRLIIPIEKQIQIHKAKIKPVQEIIDDAFSQSFGFDYEKFEELKTHKLFTVDATAFANNPDLRLSGKFHRDAGAFVMEQLQGVTPKKIKHYLAEPIVLGASISPSDYSDDGEYFYASMATIKNWLFEAEEAKLVSKAYSNEKQAKTIMLNDILMARSGEGTIGKVALIDNDEVQGVFADFTMRIRLSNYNMHFAYYYFRTTYFQYLVEINKKGLGNNTNIFPKVLREFPLPDISLAEQQRIVDEIKTEIEKQDLIRLKIADLRSQIDKVIEKALCQQLV